MDCSYCQTFTQKTTRHPNEPNSAPEKYWKETSVYFGPIPSSHNVLVVQDLASHYPVAKIITSTNAKSLIPLMYQLEFHLPICFFRTVTETTYPTNREARQIDSDIIKKCKSTYNSSRHTVDMNYKIGDQVLL